MTKAPILAASTRRPNPLTYLSAGMIASYMNEITALAAQRDYRCSANLELVLEKFLLSAMATSGRAP